MTDAIDWRQLAAFAALGAVALLVLLRPWWMRAARQAIGLRGANVAAYRTRIAEIERDAEAGVLPAAEVDALKAEAAVRLLGDAASVEPDAPKATMPRALGPVVALLLFAAAGVGYRQSGSWQAAQQIAAGAANAAPALPPEVEAMVAQLADRLREQPDDPEGWSRLGRAYFVMKRFSDAAIAYGEANARNGGRNAETLAGEAEARAFADGLRVTPDAMALIERALQVDPDEGRALWYGGLGAAQAGDYATARARWTRLQQRELPPQMKQMLSRALAKLDETAAPAGTTAQDTTPAAANPVRLVIKVALAPALAAQAGADDTLFVFAKADAGPPMPLAVYRGAATLPAEVTLDDSMAMTPAMRLSAFARYRITARLSRSGGAQAQPGDLEGSLVLDRAAADRPAEILIDHVVR